MILHYLDTRNVGGIETHVETIAAAQRDLDLDARILVHKNYVGSPSQARLAAGPAPVQVAGSFSGLLGLLRHERPAMLHTHGYKAGILGRIAARLAGVPVISTFHAGERGTGAMRLYQLADEWSAWLGGRLAVSQAIADALPFGAKVIRNFVTPAQEARPEPAGPMFLFAGRLSAEKGPDLFQALAASRAAAGRWVMVGDGPMRDGLERTGATPVEMAGLAPSITPWLAQASALVMTSRREGLPMAALEAMAQGVPVIAPSTGGLGALIDHGRNGFLYPTGDMEAAAACIDRLAAMPAGERNAMGEASLTTIRDHYSPAVVLPGIIAHYRKAGYRG